MKELEALRDGKWHYIKILGLVLDSCSQRDVCTDCPWSDGNGKCSYFEVGDAIQRIGKAIEKKEAAISGEIPFTE